MMSMKLLKVFLPAIVASLLLFVLFVWVDQSAQASAMQPGDLKLPDSWQASNFNLPASSDVITKVLPSGDSYIHGLIYYNGYLYASTRSCAAPQSCAYPARVLKIDPNTLGVVITATLTSLNAGEDIVAANGYIWVILFMKPARLIRLDPATLNWSVALEFNKSVAETMEAGASLKNAFGYLWAGGTNHLARVDISDPLNPTYQLYDISFLNLPKTTDGYGSLGSLAYDNQFLWGTYKQYSSTLSLYYASTVVKMDPNNPTGAYAKTEIHTNTPDDSAYVSGGYFVGGESHPSTTPSYIYKFSTNPAVYTATKAAPSASYGLFSNPADPLSVWGAYVASPGLVKIFNLNATPLLTITLPTGFDSPSEIAFDDSGDVFITTWQDPAKIVKLTPPYLPADLRIADSGSPDPVYAGNKITYTLAITNDGPLNAIGVNITDTLPSQVSFISSVPGSSQCSIHNQVLTCALGDLGANSSRQVVISARVNDMASGTITNSAKGTSSTYDTNLQNNTTTRQTTVINSADLKIQNSADKTRVTSGDLLEYSIEVDNIGPTRALSVTLQDVLPAGVDFVSSAPGSYLCTNQNAIITCDVGKLEATKSVLIQLFVRVNQSAMNSLHNSVSVSSVTPDPVASNNSASLITSVYHLLYLPITR
jgi:uncharacterized repeat protein (TIGR01451 family)